MPARTLNDFAAGFFYGESKTDLEASMAIGHAFAGRRSTNGTTEKALEVPCADIEPFKASKIL